jgi:UDP-N-acetylglucosamine 2-epimerase (non-hydrolysing)
MRVMTILGTRPEIIRLSRIIPLLDEYADHTLVHTGQNYAERLSDLFFSELGVRAPDHYLGVRAASFGEQIGQILTRIEPLFLELRPERLLVLGDTNSGLAAIVAKRLGIQVFHMEAGNRCFDDRVPEEVNRRIIDHSSTVLMPYTHRSKENLLAEGIARQRILVTGNPIKQVLDHYGEQISNSGVVGDLGLEPGRFFQVTMHRAENVDIEARLRQLVDALEGLHRSYGHPVVCSLHPRTRSRVESFGVDLKRSGLRFVEPLGFFDFLRLEQAAFCILTDSGTVQEEACLLRKPNVTIRDVTERPETIECGSNILSGADPEVVARCVALVTGRAAEWEPPAEYLMPNVAETVVRIVLGFRLPDRVEAEWMGA